MLYHVGDSRHAQNIQINKVIGENEKCVFYFLEKYIWMFWPARYFREYGLRDNSVKFIDTLW